MVSTCVVPPSLSFGRCSLVAVTGLGVRLECSWRSTNRATLTPDGPKVTIELRSPGTRMSRLTRLSNVGYVTARIGGRRPTRDDARRTGPVYAGRTLWLRANRLVGSYRRLTAASRWYAAAG
ncbi:hypothetical protein APR04_002002 [Promicromonospora umidemergens]|uniref:Uncharacterized protein n=1 Tax=Promicromonospora umidemergens TaxID=629679 RepID=A0ABP8XDV7_9MICO|nr:hypothetical protein [Promicromonospora umidemergens]